MNKKIMELKKQFPKEFAEYEKELLAQNIESVREGLGILLSIKGVLPKTQEDDNE